MMKNKILIIVLVGVLIVGCIFLGGIIAFNNDISKEVNDDNLILTCESNEIRLNEEVKCILKGNVIKYDVSALSSTIEENSMFELVNVIPHSSWEGDGEMGDVDLYTDINKSNEFDVLTFHIKLINDSIEVININIIDNSFFDENYEEHKLANVTKTLKVGK